MPAEETPIEDQPYILIRPQADGDAAISWGNIEDIDVYPVLKALVAVLADGKPNRADRRREARAK